MIKKAQMNIGKLFIFMAIAFSLVIILAFIMYYVHTLSSAFLPVAQKMMIDGTNNASMDAYTNTIGQLNEGYSPMAWIPIGIIMALVISIMISCFMARNHPVVIIPYAFIVVVAVIFSVPLSNTYIDLLSNNTIGTELNGFLGVSWFFSYLPYWIAIIGLVGGFLIILNTRTNDDIYY